MIAQLVTDPMNPNRPANWRWERARWLREKGRYARARDGDDEYVQLARRFQTDLGRAASDAAVARLARRYPGIFWAHEQFNGDGDVRWQLEAYLLSGMAPDEIAAVVGTDVGIVVWYEKLFFNVLPRLANEGWVISVVMGSSVHHGVTEREYDLLWKMVGYGIGPVYLRDFIRPITGHRVRDREAIGAATDEWIGRQTKKKTAIGFQTMPVFNNQAIIFEAWNRAREIEKSQTGAGSQIGIIQNVQVAMASLPFTAGRRDNGTPPALAACDATPGELRAGEQLRLTTGQDDAVDLTGWAFPAAPRPADAAAG